MRLELTEDMLKIKRRLKALDKEILQVILYFLKSDIAKSNIS